MRSPKIRYVIAGALAGLLAICLFPRLAHERLRVHRDDYPVLYRQTLDAMLGGRWRVASMEEKYEQPTGCEHMDLTPYKYIEWTLRFKDGDRRERTFMLSNHRSLADQAEGHVKDWISGYYEANFFQKYLEGVPLAQPSDVFCFFTDPDSGADGPRAEAVNRYRGALSTPQGAVALSQMTPANAFRLAPIYLSIFVCLDESSVPDSQKEALERRVRARTEAMIGDMVRFSGGGINMHVYVDINEAGARLYDGQSRWKWFYVQGERQSGMPSLEDHERNVFDRYRGAFW